jgi:hypothetical protein
VGFHRMDVEVRGDDDGVPIEMVANLESLKVFG